MPEMPWQAWVSLSTVAGVFFVLQFVRSVPSDLACVGALIGLTLLGILSPEQALAAFGNTGVITIAALFVVAEGLNVTGVLDWIGHRLLGTARTERSALVRLAASVPVISAFLANTPLVAMMLPVVMDWCRRTRVSPSRLLIPLSYFAILGGVCTLIGTSTTLVVNSLLPVDQRMGLFEIGQVGVFSCLGGTLMLVFFSHKMLPNRTEMVAGLNESRREYLVEMLVGPACRLAGRSVEAAGLRHLPGLFLIEIDRAGETITPVAPDDVIHADDRLIFTGDVGTIVDLEKIPGLVPAADRTYEMNPWERQRRHLTEAVVSHHSPLVGKTIREANFRRLYNAAVVAVHRNGQRLTGKVGGICLIAGDTLLLQTRTEFVEEHRHSGDFYMVGPVEGSRPRRHHRAGIAAGLMLLLVLWLGAGPWIPNPALSSPPLVCLMIAGLMILTRCVSAPAARGAVDLHIVLTIAGAVGLGTALTVSGATSTLAAAMLGGIGADHPWMLLAVLYLTALVLTEIVTNSAVAAMLVPLALQISQQSGLNSRPFVMAVSLAASCSFITPIGYQTNLMVLGPGGYRVGDFLRAGIPVTSVVTVISILLIPLVWPFYG